MPARFTQHNQRFRPSSKEDQVVEKAKEHFERTLVAIRGELAGSVAALEHPNHDEALNYGEIFLRDNVPVMIYLLLQNRFPVVKHFQVCLDLQSTTVQTRGVFPTSFVEEEGELIADKAALHRLITSVDASLSTIRWIYVKRAETKRSASVSGCSEGCSSCLILCCTPALKVLLCCSCRTAPS